MRTLVVIASRDSYNSWPNNFGLPFSVLENLNTGVEIADKSLFCPTKLLLTGWRVSCCNSLQTLDLAMMQWLRQCAPYVVSKVVEPVHPSPDCGESDNEYYEWEASTILLTAKHIVASRIRVISYGPNEIYRLQLTQGFEDFKVNNSWARNLNVRYITDMPLEGVYS